MTMAARWPVLLMVRELNIGGCERDLTKIALRLDRARFEPHVACFIDEGFRAAELRAAGVPVLRLPVRSLMGRSTVEGAFRMRRYIREHGIRLVHAFDVPTDLFGIPAARWAGVPAVASQLSYRSMYSKLGRVSMALIDRMADRMVVNSHAVARELVEERGVRAEKICVSHNGVDTSEFYPVAGAPRPVALEGASLVIGSVCALRAEKRLDLLIRAFARVRAEGLRLLIEEAKKTLKVTREVSVAEVSDFSALHDAQREMRIR